MLRREFLKVLAAGGTAAGTAPSLFLAACGSGASTASAGDGTLRVISSQALSSLDPIWTTAPGTRSFGFLVYDQLVATDANNVPRPQMASWTVEDGGKAYLFTLRDGLKFHDDAPVRSADCIASIRRWAARDPFGGVAMQHIADMQAVDDKSFRVTMKQPFPLLPQAFGKASAPSLMIMPERLAKTDPTVQVTEAIGSGPYKFDKASWVPGTSVTLTRFDGYVPRSEPTDGLAGGRKAGAPRLEITQISDASTALAALQAGEQDYWDAPPSDLVATLRADPNIVVDTRYTLPQAYMLQLNHLQPPFDKVAVRQALAMAIDQTQMLRAVVADPALIKPCHSFFACGTPYGSEDGSDLMRAADPAKAKAALAAAGYGNEKVVLLAPPDGPFAPIGPVLEDLMRRIGFNVELVTLDFASITQRRTNKGPVDKGGWSGFLTGWLGSDIIDPGVHPMLRGAGEKGYAGWADDPKIEELRAAWSVAQTGEEQARIGRELQIEAARTLPYIPLGGTSVSSAWRKNVTGIFTAPAPVYFNLGKSA
jgi:peptide/nickel transport system substrate-binding protein